MHQLRNIEIFAEVANCLSISKAAQNLSLTPSSVSMSVQKLEGALGARLLTRTTRQLMLTADGQAFFEHAQEGLSRISEGIDLLSNREGPLSGPLRVSVMSSFGRHFVLPMLPKFMEAHPGISLEISLDGHLPDLIKERIDLALCAEKPENGSYVGRHLCAPAMVLVASPAYLASHSALNHPNDLANHKLISVVPHSGATPSWVIRERLALVTEMQEPVMLEPKSSLNIIESYDCAIDAALAGLGVALVLNKAAAEHLAAGTLVSLLPGHDVSTSQGTKVFLLYPSKKYLPARVRVFIDFLVDIGRRDGWNRGTAVEHHASEAIALPRIELVQPAQRAVSA